MDVSGLSGTALRTLYLIAAMKERAASGVLLDREPEPIGPAWLASLAGLCRASAARRPCCTARPFDRPQAG